jgi:ribonuclease HI
VDYLDARDLNVYVDGSALSAPRRGGVGIVFITEDRTAIGLKSRTTSLV